VNSEFRIIFVYETTHLETRLAAYDFIVCDDNEKLVCGVY